MKAYWIRFLAAVLMIISAGQALSDESLAKKSGCLECHNIDKNIIGPPFHDIAEKYKNDPQARMALIQTVKNGGKGNWTEISHGVPMPPYSPRLSDDEIERLVDWVLKL
jgi:cytochrome c551/c552